MLTIVVIWIAVFLISLIVSSRMKKKLKETQLRMFLIAFLILFSGWAVFLMFPNVLLCVGLIISCVVGVLEVKRATLK